MIADLMGLCETDRVDLVFLNNAAPLMQHKELRDGVVPFARDSATLAKFAIRVFQQYVDTQPLPDLQHQQLRRALRAGLPGAPTDAGRGEAGR
jgi:hypothetical protein